MFPKFPWSDDRGEGTSSLYLIRVGEEVATGVESFAVVVGVEVDGWGISGVELL